jgi:hypothetical protein
MSSVRGCEIGVRRNVEPAWRSDQARLTPDGGEAVSPQEQSHLLSFGTLDAPSNDKHVGVD